MYQMVYKFVFCSTVLQTTFQGREESQFGILAHFSSEIEFWVLFWA